MSLLKSGVGDSRWEQQRERAGGILASGRGRLYSPVNVSFHLAGVCLGSSLLFNGIAARSGRCCFSAEFTCLKEERVYFSAFFIIDKPQ